MNDSNSQLSFCLSNKSFKNLLKREGAAMRFSPSVSASYMGKGWCSDSPFLMLMLPVHALGKAEDGPSPCWTPAPMWEISTKRLALAWPNPRKCGHLGNKPVDRRYFLFLCLFLSPENFAFQNKENESFLKKLSLFFSTTY